MLNFGRLPTAPCARAFSLQTVSSGPHCRAVPSMVQTGALAQRRVCARYKPMSAEDLQSSLENIDVDPKVKDNIVQAVLVKQQSQQVAKQQELNERQQQLVSNRLTDPLVLLLQQQHDYTMDAISQVRKQQDSLGKEVRELDSKLSLKVDESINKLSLKMDESISKLGTDVKEMGKEARELDNKLSLKVDESINKLSVKMDESISRLGTEVKELGKEVRELGSNQSQLRTLFYVLLAFLGPMVFKDLFPLISKLLT